MSVTLLQEVNDRTIKMEGILEANEKALGILFRTIEGNGQPGLKQRMTKLEAEHAQCLAERRAQPQKQGNLIQWLMLAVIIFGTIFNVAFVNHIKGENDARSTEIRK